MYLCKYVALTLLRCENIYNFALALTRNLKVYKQLLLYFFAKTELSSRTLNVFLGVYITKSVVPRKFIT